MRKKWLMAVAAALILTGCGKNSSQGPEGSTVYREDVSAKALVEAVAEELGENYWPDTELAPEYLDEWYGISSDMYEDAYGQTPMISANVDSLIIVRAHDDRIDDVQNAFDTYREAMVQDTMQYPTNIPKIQAAQIETFGNWVCYVQLGGPTEDVEDDDAKAIEACQRVNKQAIEVIEKRLTE